MKNRTIAVDLAKNVFQIGVSDRPGHVEKTYRLSRAKFLGFFANQELATVVMEACGSAHYWGRKMGTGTHGRSDLAAEALRQAQHRPYGCERIVGSLS